MEDDTALLDAARHKNRPKKRKGVDKQAAFIEFKQDGIGKDLEESIRDNRGELKTMKLVVKELTEKCNVAKKNIDIVKIDLDKKQDERKQQMQNQFNAGEEEEILDDDEAPQEIIDEEELGLLQRMKELKKAYRASYVELKTMKSELQSVQQSIDHAKQQLVSTFEEWYEETFDPIPGEL